MIYLNIQYQYQYPVLIFGLVARFLESFGDVRNITLNLFIHLYIYMYIFQISESYSETLLFL